MSDAASATIYRATPRRAYEYLLDIIEAGLVPNLMGSPGLGKSSLFKKLCKHFNLYMIDHRLSTSQPEDISGLPEFITNAQGQRIATFTPFDLFPSTNTPIPDGFDGWLIFYDEFNSGSKEVQAACYKPILDRMFGQTRLHDNVAQGCAGNLMTDRAFTNDLSTAMQSRMIHIELELSHKEWLEDVAIPEDYDERIIAYANFDQDFLFDFRPDHQDKTFNCPRTIEFLNKLIKGKAVTPEKTGLYAGCITSGQAAAFTQFCEIYKELATIEDVLRSPTGTPVPGRHETNKSWAIVSHLMKRVDDKNFKDICTYVNRMELTFKVLFFRGALHANPTLRHHPSYIESIGEVNKFLNEKD